MINSRCAWLWGCIACISFLPLAVHGSDFRLTIAAIDDLRRPTLSLSGLTEGRYVLQASTDLDQWFTVTSAPAGADPVIFLHNEAAALGTIFYRGLQVPDTALVVPQVDSNFVATGLITLQSGGRLALTNDAGIRYTFTVGPSNVLDTVAVRMQLVTNFGSFPYPNEMRTAVLFEPSGFEFHGAGLLEISFPTNVPHLKLSSFAFDGDGGGFHLTPDVVSTNRVLIPVTHFSGVGTGLWAPTDRTAAVTTFIDNTLDRMSQDIAGSIARERDRQNAGNEPQTEWLTEIDSRQQEFYDNNLKPFFTEAESDCALALSLTRHLLGLERQSQLLGIGNSPASSFLGSETYKKWTCNCLAEAIKACEDGKISDKTLIKTWLAAERQSQLLGGSGNVLEECGLGSLDSFLDQALIKKLPCAPEWVGVVTYSDEGSRTRDCSGGSPGVTCTATTSTSLSFETDVETATLLDESFPPFFSRQTWTLKFFPEASGSFAYDSHQVQPTACGGTITTTRRENGAQSGPLDLEIVFVFEDGELIDFNIATALNGDLAVATTEVATGVISPCAGGTGSSSTYRFLDTVSISPESVNIDEISFTKRTPTALEGSVTATRIGIDAIIMPFSWKFSLRRNGP